MRNAHLPIVNVAQFFRSHHISVSGEVVLMSCFTDKERPMCSATHSKVVSAIIHVYIKDKYHS